MKPTILSLFTLGAFLITCGASHAQTGPGTALSFDGAANVMLIGGAPLPVPWTAEFWVKRQDANGFSAALLADSNYALKLEQFNYTRRVGFTQFGVADYLFNYIAPTNTFVHLAFVCDSNTRLYVNGVLQDSYPATISLPLDRLGSDPGYGDYFKGVLDEVRVWNIARSQAQIQANMNNSLPLPQAGLVAYWRFDEGSGTMAYDFTGDYNGVLTGQPGWVTSTIPFSPSVVTLPPSQITASSATLNGLVNPNGAPTTTWFEWGLTTDYGNLTAPALASDDMTSRLMIASLDGLSPNAVFNYRVVASNSFGLAKGDNQSSVTDFGTLQLNIQLEAGNIVLSWPASATYSLQSAPGLSAPVPWSEVSRIPRLVGNENVVTLPITGSGQFFRLARGVVPSSSFNAAPTDNLGSESPINESNGAGIADDSVGPGIGQVGGGDPNGASPRLGAIPAPADTGGGQVFLHNGEMIRRVVDLVVPGRGFDWKMDRTYRSGLNFEGPLGHNWEFSYNRRLAVQSNGDVLRMDGYGRVDRYVRTNTDYVAPRGFYTQLIQYGDGTFRERDRHGAKAYYSKTNSQGVASLVALRDRNGNQTQFEYNNVGQLCRVLDTLGRAYIYTYDDATGRLIRVEDFAGRSIHYSYDVHGDLISVTSPGVTGTPNGNDFPNGKTWQYSYSSGYADERLNHNLLTVTAPNEVATNGPHRVAAQYQTDPNSPDMDRIIQLTIGGVNASGVPAGGTITYHYENLGNGVLKNTVMDPNGNQALYEFNSLGNISTVRRFTRGLRTQEPAYFQSDYTYNADGEVLSVTRPLTNRVDYTYDSGNPDRFQNGNLLNVIVTPDAARGGDQTLLQTTMRYEPVYNQLSTVTSPRGNDGNYLPQNGGPNASARYTTVFVYDYQEGQEFSTIAAELGVSVSEVFGRLSTIQMGLGDVNGDSLTSQTHGNQVRTIRPTVNLLAGSNEADVEGTTAQPVVTLLRYNRYGQTTEKQDPEGNVTRFSYHPENDPSGFGSNQTRAVSGGAFGYLRQVVIDSDTGAGRDSGTDPVPAAITIAYVYDAVGNVTRKIDGRGIATDYFVNQLNQTVQITRSAAHSLTTNSVTEPLPLTDFQYLTRIFYDANDNVIERQVEDRGNTSGTAGFVGTLYRYDILDHKIQMAQEVNTNTFLLSQYRYDGNGNETLTVQPEGNAIARLFDERNLLFQTTIGATNASPGTLGSVPIGAARGGTPATYTVNYDANANIIEFSDAGDKDGSLANNSSIAGFGDVTSNYYDGFDRLARRVDAVGNQALYSYDPDGNCVRVVRQGPIGGGSPTDNLGLSNVDLSVLEFSYDELRRMFQRDDLLFVAQGVTTQRAADVADGPLTPGDNKVTTRFEYDRNSRNTFVVSDDWRTVHTAYDGAGRVIKQSDVLSNSVESAFDGNSNLIETRQTDVCQIPSVPNEVFITTYFYDTLDRLQRREDNLGQTVEYRYDSRDNRVAMSDGNGPIAGPRTLRVFSGGTLTANTVNGFGNVTLYSYDGLGRVSRVDRVMTSSGKGDGANIGADIFGVRTTTPPSDPTQAGGDGLITTRYQWDGNSLLTSLTDDNGNQTVYTYDNLNRQLTETEGVCTQPSPVVCAAPTTISYSYDPDGNRIQLLDENGSIVSNRFDAVNRLIATEIAPGSNVIGTTLNSYEYDGLSRLVRGSDNNDPTDSSDDAVVTFAYDSLGDQIEETQQIGSTAPKAVSSSWRSGILRTSLTYPNGRVVTNAFDALDRISTIADATGETPLASYNYIGQARIIARDYPINSTHLTYLNDGGTLDVGYDGVGRATQIRHLFGTTSLLLGFNHGYDRANNPLIEEKPHVLTDSELYHYDSAYRLTEFDRGSLDTNNTAILVPSPHAPLQTNWVLDGVGNWSQVDNEIRVHNSFNQIVQRSNDVAVAITSDANGNELDNGTLTFRYDYRNRLREVNRKSDDVLVAIYSYDSQNRRISKTVFNSAALDGTTRFLLSGGNEIEERNGLDELLQQYVYGLYIDEPLILDRNLDHDEVANGSGDQRLFYHANRLHSVCGLTDYSGRMVEGYEYDAYGTRTVFSGGPDGAVTFGGDDSVVVGVTSAFGNPYGFTGRRFDAESGLYYYRNRYLDPKQGRFISRDPIGYRGGLDLYAYCVGSPIARVDPSGCNPLLWWLVNAPEISEWSPLIQSAWNAWGNSGQYGEYVYANDEEYVNFRRWLWGGLEVSIETLLMNNSILWNNGPIRGISFSWGEGTTMFQKGGRITGNGGSGGGGGGGGGGSNGDGSSDRGGNPRDVDKPDKPDKPEQSKCPPPEDVCGGNPYCSVVCPGNGLADPDSDYGLGSGTGLPPGVIRIPRGWASYDPEGGRSGSSNGGRLPPGVSPPGGPAGTPNPEGGGPIGPATRAGLQRTLLTPNPEGGGPIGPAATLGPYH